MRRIHPFVWGHVLGALLVGALSGAFLDAKAVMTFSSILAASAVVSSLVSWWRPGFGAVGWKLWLVATFANPLFLAGIAYSINEWDCLFKPVKGWTCMFSDLGWMAAVACLPSPLIGLAVRWWTRTK